MNEEWLVNILWPANRMSLWYFPIFSPRLLVAPKSISEHFRMHEKCMMLKCPAYIVVGVVIIFASPSLVLGLGLAVRHLISFCTLLPKLKSVENGSVSSHALEVTCLFRIGTGALMQCKESQSSGGSMTPRGTCPFEHVRLHVSPRACAPVRQLRSRAHHTISNMWQLYEHVLGSFRRKASTVSRDMFYSNDEDWVTCWSYVTFLVSCSLEMVHKRYILSQASSMYPVIFANMVIWPLHSQSFGLRRKSNSLSSFPFWSF